MTGQVGAGAGTVYTADEVRQGKGASPGARVASGSKEYQFCSVVAGQVLTDGQIVTIDGATFAVTVAAAGAPTGGSGQRIGVARCSVTASTSTYIWCQIWGVASVRASSNALPNVGISIGTVAGQVDDGGTSASGYIVGLTLTATATSNFAAAFLNYPQFGIA